MRRLLEFETSLAAEECRTIKARFSLFMANNQIRITGEVCSLSIPYFHVLMLIVFLRIWGKVGLRVRLLNLFRFIQNYSLCTRARKVQSIKVYRWVTSALERAGFKSQTEISLEPRFWQSEARCVNGVVHCVRWLRVWD